MVDDLAVVFRVCVTGPALAVAAVVVAAVGVPVASSAAAAQAAVVGPSGVVGPSAAAAQAAVVGPSGVVAQAAATPTTPTTPVATTPSAAEPEVPDDDAVVPRSPTRKVSYAARLVAPVVVRKRPSAKGKRIATLQPFGSWNGGPVVLQIAEVKMVGKKRWLRVRLPIRPNGSTGWLPESRVAVSKLRYRITISRKARKLTLLRDGKRIGSTGVVIGAPSTPTPAGSFAVLEVVKQPKGEVLGPWALHLTAHSNVLDDYGGGPGRVALHGRSGGLLNDPLGSARSHGCIRMPNAFVSRLAKVAVEGTPVTIT